jgi:tetratricopeptide (TPR) repeat protein
MKPKKTAKKKSKRKLQDEKPVARFIRICEEEFRSILDQYGLARTRVDDPGSGYMYHTIIFQNETTALRVYFEWRDVYLSVQICGLVDGQIQEPLLSFNEPWTTFHVGDLLSVTAPDYDQSPLMVSRSYEDFTGEDAVMEQIRLELRIYAAALAEYGGDILGGDFTIFPELDRFAKQRVKNRQAEIEEESKAREIAASDDLADYDAPNDAWQYFERASIYFQSGMFDEAIADFNKALALDPQLAAAAYANCATAYDQLDETELALDNCNKALALNPDDSVTLILRGNIHVSMGDLTASLADFDWAIAVDPTDPMAYSNRGATYSKLGDVQRAIDDYGLAIKWNPEYANSYANRAFAYYKVGEYEKGLVDCDKALALRPDHAASYSNRGLCRAALGDAEGAAADFRRALELPCPPVVREEALSGLRDLGLETG